MELRELQVNFKNEATTLGNYDLMTKTFLANGYCIEDDALEQAIKDNDTKAIMQHSKRKSAYFAALMLRYWYKIFEWQDNSKSLQLPITDFVDWLYEGLYVAFYYKVWYYPFKAKVKEGKFISWELDENGEKIPNPYYYETDPNAPDKIINRCCGSIRGREYQFYNKHKRKLDVHTYSYDSMLEDVGDSAVYDSEDGYIQPEFANGTDDLIKMFLNRGDLVAALIVHGIANYDAFKDVKVDGVESSIFDARKLVKHLNSISPAFMNSFCESYEICDLTSADAYARLKGMNNTKLYRCIEKTLNEIKLNKDLLNCLF